MRRLVFAVIAILALFTFIRESLPARPAEGEIQQASLQVDPLK